MGTDIDGLISHNLRFPFEKSLPNDMSIGITPSSPFIREVWAWEEKYFCEERFRVISNNGGPTVWLGMKCVIISTSVNWVRAATDLKLAGDIFSATFAIARFFKAKQTIFLPDDVEPWCSFKEIVIENGLPFSELVKRLREEEAPSPTLAAAIKGQPDYVVDGYLIETTPE